MEKTMKPKKSGVKDMTQGSPYKLIISFALPVFLSQVFQQLYNTADALIVGNFLGTEALAAVTSSGTLIFLMISFFAGMAMGAGVVIGRHFGAKQYEDVKRAIHTDLAFGLLSGLVLTVVGVLFTPTFLRWMNTDPEVLPNAIEYFRVYFFGALAMVMYNTCRSIMNALGDSRRPLYYLIISSLINVLLDLLFVGVFRFGVWSAALATVISQGVSVVLCMAYLCKKGQIFSVELKKIRFHLDMLGEIVRLGLPSGVQNSMIALANVIVQTQINSFGKVATAAYGTHSRIEGFAFLPMTSFNTATTTFVSQNLGAKLPERAKKGAGFSIIASVSMAEVVGILYYIFAPQLIWLFDRSPQVIAIGTQQARTVALFFCLLAFSHAIAAVCHGAGKAFVPMVIMLSVWCVIRILYILCVMHFFGELQYVFWAYPLTWAISSVIYLIYYTRSNWAEGFQHRPGRG